MKVCSTLVPRDFTPRPSRRESGRLPDSFQPSWVEEPTIRPRFTPSVPDVRGMLAQGLRYSDLNLGINTAYVSMARQFQDIYDLPHQGMPSWYAFAPFASREAGKGMRRAELALRLLENGEGPGSAAELVDQLFDCSEARPDGMVEVVTAARLTRLMAGLEGSPRERLTQVARSVLNLLEAGNLAIVSEIGVAGQDYLEWRNTRTETPSPPEVLSQFAWEPEQSQAMFSFMRQAVEGGGELPIDFEKPFPEPAFDRKHLLPACFAAYEAARTESDPEIKKRWIQQAGIALAFREQHDVVAQAFENTPPGEIDRMEVFHILTPFVQVPHRGGTWSYQEMLGTRVLDKNWAEFPDRWEGILNFFDDVFAEPTVLWPMPDPHPDRDL